ncbi:hypothetical protein [Streptomyces sp. SID13726]|uniref:hypothetical protein n=1 Tax=Streptomyces sp. SID13726 TaxID=2706058 RepID=UPI0013BDF15A|nr:hypothetical protein [Streptomyces sp. SID13726]NEB04503.1 hypothetical protein [Streptomyces sp. SID13726]
MTTWKSGMLVTAARLADDTPTTTTSGLTASTGFTVSTFSGYRAGNVVIVDMFMNRSGADITASSGNITDTACCTLPSGWRPTSQTINGSWDNGSVSGGFVCGTDGICTLRSAGGNIVSGTNLRMHLEFIVD